MIAFYTLPPTFAHVMALSLGITLYFATNIYWSVGVLVIAGAALALPTLNKTYIPILFFMILGFTRSLVYQKINQGHIQTPTICTITGTVGTINHLEKNRYTHSYQINVEKIEEATTDITTPFNLLIYSKKIEIEVGERITLKRVQLKPIKSSSYAWYLIKEGIHATAFIDKPEYTSSPNKAYSLKAQIANMYGGLVEALKHKMSKPCFTLFSSLFVGDRSHNKWIVHKTTDEFSRWGILHYLARSGLHLVIFILLWHSLFMIIPLSFWIKQTLLTSLILCYAALTVPSVSFNRALIVFLLKKGSDFFYRPTHFMHILSTTALLILLYNPAHLFFLDFQLTFCLTMALALVNKK